MQDGRAGVVSAPATTTDSAADVAGAQFRHAMGHFATGVTVVTCAGPGGQPLGTTANAVTSLSLDPPLLLVCLDRASVTLAAIRARGAFAVNVLAAAQQQLSVNFARRGQAAGWDDVPYRPGATGSPLLHGVLATVECTVEVMVDDQAAGGDHEIVIGRVREVAAGRADGAPLLFWRGEYARMER
jgi:flavin reductase (DIM6/NTAB) family NADH-FMN oxidoreductase RutF